jgi:DNA-binding NarL/FixJ family response regulator
MPQAPKLFVMIVDDHLLLRQGVKQLLGTEYRDLAFGEARNAEQAVAHFHAHPWRLVILDIGLPGADGFSVLQELRTHRPETPVLMLSMHSDSVYAARSLRLGAAGYVSKSAGRSTLLKAVKSVLAGQKYFTDPIRLGAVGTPTPVALHASLSTQESNVLLAIAAGARTGEIAAQLNLSAKTVSTYKRRVLNKLGLTSTAGLVRYVIDHQLA